MTSFLGTTISTATTNKIITAYNADLAADDTPLTGAEIETNLLNAVIAKVQRYEKSQSRVAGTSDFDLV